MDLLRNDKTNAVKELRIKVSETKSQLALSQKNFEKAQIELKNPEEKFALCDKILKRAQKEYTRWLAEAVNIERHVALRNLRNLQGEEEEIKGILHQAKELKKSALQSLEVATQSLRELPGKISGCEQIMAEQKSVLREAEKGRERVIQAIEEKKSYISEVSQLASLAKGKSESEETDSTLGEASEKFQETLTLLRKDLAETENQLAGKEQVLQDAKQAVSKAEHNLREILTLQKSTPLLVKKNEDSLAEAKKKEVGTEINYNQFKTRFAQQSVKTEALLKKYLDLLPR
jgi:chromosome segregation ATPase